MKCNICPRGCNVDRSKSSGFCQAKDQMVISKVMLHPYEEDILTDERHLSGAIFFSGCNLRCVYCQNYEISHELRGEVTSPKELAEIMKKLVADGASNIDLVTPTHFTEKIIEALKIYKPPVPVIWNTSGYESVSTIDKLNGYIDIFLTDFKYMTPEIAKKYSLAADYPTAAETALRRMKTQKGENVFSNGKLVSGIIVRHMVLPGQVKDSIKVLDKVKEILGSDAIVSIMSQYTPMGRAKDFKEIDRKITPLEYKLVTNHAIKLGLNNALVQDLDSASSCYTPDFEAKNKK